MRLIGLLVAILLGVGAFMLTMNLQKKEEKKDTTKIVEVPKVVVQEVPTVDILVARQEVPVGTPLTEALLDRQPWPSHLVLEDFIVSDGQDKAVVGMVTRSPFRTREPVIKSKLANPNDPSFLAAGLADGMRAVTISVDVLSSVAGFVFPGDRVDVLINHRVFMGVPDPENPRASDKGEDIMEVLVPNVKVIAIDQAATGAAGQPAKVPASVTMEVSRNDAQRLKLGESKGKLVLALRPLNTEKDNDEISPPTGLNDLTRIMPPSYYPILYDSSGEYASVVINPFSESGDKQLTDKKKQEIQSVLANTRSAGAIGISGGLPKASGAAAMAPAKDSDTDSKAKVSVVHGVQKEEIEVRRP